MLTDKKTIFIRLSENAVRSFLMTSSPSRQLTRQNPEENVSGEQNNQEFTEFLIEKKTGRCAELPDGVWRAVILKDKKAFSFEDNELSPRDKNIRANVWKSFARIEKN